MSKITKNLEHVNLDDIYPLKQWDKMQENDKNLQQNIISDKIKME